MKFKVFKIADKENIKKLFLFFKNLPWLIGDNVFSFFIIMILIAVVIGSFFFVRNIIQIEHRMIINPSQLPVLNEKAIRGILDSWQFRQNKFDGVNGKIYPDLFLPKSE